MLNRTLPASRKLNVAIIGAGVAGLRAADVLLQHGIGVTIFEARNRIGGRLAQGLVGGHVVDLYVLFYKPLPALFALLPVV